MFLGFFKMKQDPVQDFFKLLLRYFSELRIQKPTKIDSRLEASGSKK
jgi:hypothetical protein